MSNRVFGLVMAVIALVYCSYVAYDMGYKQAEGRYQDKMERLETKELELLKKIHKFDQ